MTSQMKDLMGSMTNFGVATYPVGPRVQVALEDPVPSDVVDEVEPGEDFPIELLDLYRASDGLQIIGDSADAEASRLAIFPWDRFADIDEMHDDMGFADRFEGVYAIGTYGSDDLVLVDTMGIHGKGKQAVFRVAKANLMSPPTVQLAGSVTELMLKVLSGKRMP